MQEKRDTKAQFSNSIGILSSYNVRELDQVPKNYLDSSQNHAIMLTDRHADGEISKKTGARAPESRGRKMEGSLKIEHFFDSQNPALKWRIVGFLDDFYVSLPYEDVHDARNELAEIYKHNRIQITEAV